MIDFCKTWWARIATKEMVFVSIVTLAASLVASWLKQFPGFSLFGALIIALLIGMAVQFPILQMVFQPFRGTQVRREGRSRTYFQ